MTRIYKSPRNPQKWWEKEGKDETKNGSGNSCILTRTVKFHTNRSPEQSDTWHIHRCKTCRVRIGKPHLDAMDEPQDQWDTSRRNNP